MALKKILVGATVVGKKYVTVNGRETEVISKNDDTQMAQIMITSGEKAGVTGMLKYTDTIMVEDKTDGVPVVAEAEGIAVAATKEGMQVGPAPQLPVNGGATSPSELFSAGAIPAPVPPSAKKPRKGAKTKAEKPAKPVKPEVMDEFTEEERRLKSIHKDVISQLGKIKMARIHRRRVVKGPTAITGLFILDKKWPAYAKALVSEAGLLVPAIARDMRPFRGLFSELFIANMLNSPVNITVTPVAEGQILHVTPRLAQ